MNTDIVDEIKKYKIGVVAGGFSSEKEISLKSGRAVFDALVSGGINAEFIEINETNRLSFISDNNFDVAFIALHGKFGEDGEIQKQLESNGIKYTGSGPEASLMALDKYRSKKIFQTAGLNVPAYKLIEDTSKIENCFFSIPCVVKPRYEGSSVGLFVVKEWGDLKPALRSAAAASQDIIIEEFIRGREVTVGVIDKNALPVVEIKASDGVYDYGSKYLASDTEYFVPADLTPSVYISCQRAALLAHRSLGCRGFSRTDIRISEEDIPYVLEVNTIPGLTERSLLPMAARSIGLDFFHLCVKMIELSIKES